MREIKFRGLKKSDNQWIIGDLNHIDGRVYIFDRETLLNSTEDYEVRPETVGEFTGLQDKNGVDIYEGDLVEIQFPAKQKVQAEILFEYCSLVMAMDEYANRDFATAMEECENSDLRLHELLTIIGNIHETPTT